MSPAVVPADVASLPSRALRPSTLGRGRLHGSVPRARGRRVTGGRRAFVSGTTWAASPEIDLEHRVLLASARRGDDPHELVERGIALAARTLERDTPRAVAAGRPATRDTRRALVAGAREALAADPQLSLPQLARELAVSPHHLSRIFSSATGTTISRHRMRLRVRAAMERLAGGERDLARLAANLGFVDESHLCRVVKSETRWTPSALRKLLRGEHSRSPLRPI